MATPKGGGERALFTWLGPPAEAGLDQKSADIDIYKWMQLQFQIWMRFEMSHTLICGDSDVNQTLKYATVSYLPLIMSALYILYSDLNKIWNVIQISISFETKSDLAHTWNEQTSHYPVSEIPSPICV